jgi:O-antigen/teichoic acid export membrane protein
LKRQAKIKTAVGCAKVSISERLNALLSSPTRRRLANGAIWGGVAAAGSRGITVAASFFLARILGQSAFGEYGMVNSTADMIGSLAGMGIGLTVTKHVAEFKSTDIDKVGRILALSSMVTMVSAFIYGVALVVLAPWLAEKTLAAPHIAPLLQISAITVALGVVNGVQTSSLAGVEAFRANSYTSVGIGIVQSVMVVAGAWAWQLKGAVIAMAAGMVLTVIVTRWVVSCEWRRFNIRLHWREACQEYRVLLNFSLPTFLTILFIGPVYWACNAFLANQPNGYAEFAIFNAGTQWQGAIQMLPGLVGTAMIPLMSEKIGARDRAGAFNLTKKMMGINALIVVPIAVMVSLLSPLIMSGYGDSFVNGYWTIVLLCITAAISTMVSVPISQFVVATGQMWLALALNICGSLAVLIASFFMARWGAEGLSSARLLSAIVHSALFFIFFKKGEDIEHPKNL